MYFLIKIQNSKKDSTTFVYWLGGPLIHMLYELIKGPLKQVVKSFGNDQKVRLIFLPFI